MLKPCNHQFHSMIPNKTIGSHQHLDPPGFLGHHRRNRTSRRRNRAATVACFRLRCRGPSQFSANFTVILEILRLTRRCCNGDFSSNSAVDWTGFLTVGSKTFRFRLILVNKNEVELKKIEDLTFTRFVHYNETCSTDLDNTRRKFSLGTKTTWYQRDSRNDLIMEKRF